MSLAGLGRCVSVPLFEIIIERFFLFRMIGCPLFSFAGVCLSGGPIDQLHRCDSLYCSAASDPQHVLPTLDCLAHLLWALEPHHDSFPLLQSCQHFPWIPPSSKIMITLFDYDDNVYLF